MAKFTYFPMLRSKAGEASALQNISAGDKARLFPIIHLTQTIPATFSDSLLQSWVGRPIALDASFNFGLSGTTANLTQLFDKLGKGSIPVIPCAEVGIAAPLLVAVQKMRNRYAPGIVVKAKLNQLPQLAAWAGSNSWPANEIDLIVDAGEVAGYDPGMFHPYVAQALNAYLSANSAWRSVTLAASAAPKDHGGFNVGRTDIPRLDWRLWQGVSGNAGVTLNYGDYGVGHPDLTEPPGPAMAGATVSVRYALDDTWINLKGTRTSGAKGQPMDKQYRAHAKILVADPNFAGLPNCWGDDRIQQVAAGSPKAGSRATWASWNYSRHITLVANRLP